MTAASHIDFEKIIEREDRRSIARKGWIKPIFALLISAVWVVPFYYLFISIFKTTEEYSLGHPLALPSGLAPILSNAETAWVQAKMGNALMNSMIYSTVGAGLAVFIAALAAFGLSRIDFNRKNFWFMILSRL